MAWKIFWARKIAENFKNFLKNDKKMTQIHSIFFQKNSCKILEAQSKALNKSPYLFSFHNRIVSDTKLQ